MNFTQDIIKEILQKPPKDKCCKKAFLAGILRGSGVLFLKDDAIGVEFSLLDEEAANFASELIKTLYGYEIREIEAGSTGDGRSRFSLTAYGENVEEILKDLGILVSENESFSVNLSFNDGEILNKECCSKNFFRGLFIACGRCVVPDGKKNKSYYLKMSFSHAGFANDVSAALYKKGIVSGVSRARNKYILYVKNSEEIKNFCAFLGAGVCVLKLTEIMIDREVSGEANRKMNCDMGNVKKQINAVEKQLKAIEKLKNSGELEKLSDDLKETAKARVDNPEDSLYELSGRLNVSRSCLNHRLRRLVALSEQK